MPMGEIAAHALGGLVRVVASVVLEFVFELLVKGTGYAIIRVFRPQSEPGDTACGIVGVAVWAGIVVGGVLLYRNSVAG